MIFIFEEKKIFNYVGFAKYLKDECPNIIWGSGTSSKLIGKNILVKVIEIELCVDKEMAKKILQTMIELDIFYYYSSEQHFIKFTTNFLHNHKNK